MGMQISNPVTKADLGLGNVSNTSDADKPISSASQTALDAKASSASLTSTLASHTSNTGNPHSVTKTQVGLGSVNNTADTDKPVSSAQQAALDLKANLSDVPQPAIITPSSPTTGQTVSSSTSKSDETLYITPAGTLLALTIALPAVANSRVGQIVRGFISQIITGLTVNVAGSGVAVGTLPITSSINSSFAYQCVSVSGNGTWVRLY